MTSIVGGQPLNPFQAFHPSIPLNLNFLEGAADLVYDYSGNNNYGTIVEGVWDADSRGIKLNGSDSYINCGTDPSLQTTTSFSLESVVMCERAEGESPNRNAICVPKGPPGGGFWFFISYNKLRVQEANSPWDSINTGDDTIQNDIFYHTVMTYDSTGATNIKLYINGSEEASGPLPVVVNNPFILGKYSTHDYFEGIMNQFMFYNKILTPTEIAHNYQKLRRRYHF